MYFPSYSSFIFFKRFVYKTSSSVTLSSLWVCACMSQLVKWSLQTCKHTKPKVFWNPRVEPTKTDLSTRCWYFGVWGCSLVKRQFKWNATLTLECTQYVTACMHHILPQHPVSWLTRHKERTTRRWAIRGWCSAVQHKSLLSSSSRRPANCGSAGEKTKAPVMSLRGNGGLRKGAPALTLHQPMCPPFPCIHYQHLLSCLSGSWSTECVWLQLTKNDTVSHSTELSGQDYE